MFPQAVRAVRELQPLAFVFENVRGLLRPGFRNYVEYIRLQLTYPDFPLSMNADWTKNLQRLERHHTSKFSEHGLRYKVAINLANAANFGVPQHRHRVFFVGFRTDLNARWFFPTETHSADELIYEQYVTGTYWERHKLKGPFSVPEALKVKIRDLERGVLPTTKSWRTVRDAIAALGDPRVNSTWKNHKYQGGARCYPGHTGSPLDEPSKALKAGDHGVPGGENMLRHPNGRVRYFSIREAARIQTFPDEFEFPGSWTESMRQLGNAVPVMLASTVVGSVGKTLKEHVRYETVQSDCNPQHRLESRA
jgi:DNA (cytosine-5)-methyltransferase 1